RWQQAFEENGLDSSFYSNRRRDFSEVLPWDHIDTGVSKAFLMRECKKAYEGDLTRNCASGCSNCGASVYQTGICFAKQRSKSQAGG
ncbi:MAG: B12-binding domain-containing radical SAM protein, partial [Bacillota bacterium]|nr:B12-binding domain-containing radical SAM protein [Bacillota bacterium]